jgi:hypothetical protein
MRSVRPYDACGGEETCIQGFVWWREGEPEVKRRLVSPRIGGRIILKWILERYAAKARTGLILFRIGTVGGRL